MTDVSVIIPARDAATTLPATLVGLERQDFGQPFEVIVVDDGSADATAEIATSATIVSKVVGIEASGPSAARNVGAATAASPRLAFLDSDCVPTPTWLQSGVASLADADYVQGRTVPDPATPMRPYDRSLYVQSLSPLYESANLFITRALFDRLGGFRRGLVPRTGKELGEDVLLGWRARRANARMRFAEDALAYHAVFPRTPSGYVVERARLRFFPALTVEVPELRDELYWARWFYSRRSASFDLALLALGLAACGRRGLPLVAALPYAREVLANSGGQSAPRRVAHIATGVAADAVAAGALLAGSLRYRVPVL